jgi:hypothetical protein
MNEGYRGRVTVISGDVRANVQAHLAGHVEPADGRFHWGGRLAPDDDMTRLFQTGVKAVSLQIDDAPASSARLAEVDPWGGLRVTAVGLPPWHAVDDQPWTDDKPGGHQ